uniref:helix-turn-helix domain-containing protein n=1 Tax=Arthrobacter mobilis TaxID=2724944 RepID=UPI001FE787A6|nr:helix-turn-helix domain-containing protein [Arthrobacter mobilis]
MSGAPSWSRGTLAKYRFFCDQALYPRRTFAESTPQVPCRARSTRRLRDALVSAVINSGRAAAETAAAHGVSWRLVQDALNHAATLLPDVDRLQPRMLGIDEHGSARCASSMTRRPTSGNATSPG